VPLRLRTAAFAASALVVVALLGPLAAGFPRPSGYVNDFAAMLTADDRVYLEDFLRAVERDTTAEVVVATVSSLDGLSIEEYANRLFTDWGVGKKAQNNGVLLLVAPAERRVRIEVGYGLEGRLPDGLAGEIIRTAIVPEFQRGNLRRGIGRGLDRIARVVRGDPLPITRATASGAGGDFPSAIVIVPFFAIFVTLGGFMAGLGLRTRTIGPLVAAGLFSAAPLLIASMMSPGTLTVLLPAELLALCLGYHKGGSDYWTRAMRSGSPHESPGEPDGWIMGGTDSSSGGSSDSGGSSFSGDFGGGSSGGGGASGRW
jgi:uncharacterized protein